MIPGSVCGWHCYHTVTRSSFSRLHPIAYGGGGSVPMVTGLWRGGPVLNPVVNDCPRALLLVKVLVFFPLLVVQVFLVHTDFL